MNHGSGFRDRGEPSPLILAEEVVRRHERYPLTPYFCGELARNLGGLAAWILRDDILQLAAQDDCGAQSAAFAHWLLSDRTLDNSPGSCWVLFVQESPLRYPLLKPSLVLPLQWRKGTDHHHLFPRVLLNLADEVLSTVRPEGNWGLHLPSGADFDLLDLRGLSLRCDSGWASLAGGLIVAADGGHPDTSVWCSGAWDLQSGVRPVASLFEKLQLANEFGVREFFVPVCQSREARAWCAENGLRLRIGELHSNAGTNARRALSAYLAALDAPPMLPDRDIPREYAEWFLRFAQRDPPRAQQLRQSALLPRIISGCRSRLAAPWRSPPKLLVTIASDNPELVAIAAGALGVQHCVVLWSKEKEREAALAEEFLAAAVVGCRSTRREFRPCADLASEFHRVLLEDLRDGSCAAEDLVFDVTPGNKLMSLALATRIAPPGAWLHYLRHERRGPHAVPGTETTLLWQSGTAPDLSLFSTDA